MQNRVSPLNNPSSDKSSLHIIQNGEKQRRVRGSVGGEEPEERGARGEIVASYIKMLARCPLCRYMNRVVFYWDKPPKYHRCQGCNELVPFGSLRVMATDNSLVNPIF